MSEIIIQQEHRLGRELARQRVQAMMEDFQAKSTTFEDVALQWDATGYRCTFSGDGLSGGIAVEEAEVTVKVTLDGFYSIFRSVAREKIATALARSLADGQ